MSESHPSPGKPTRDYAGLLTQIGRLIFAALVGILGVCLGFVGVIAFIYGVSGLFYLFTQCARVDYTEVTFHSLLFLLTCSLGIFFSLRWCRAINKIAAGYPPV